MIKNKFLANIKKTSELSSKAKSFPVSLDNFGENFTVLGNSQVDKIKFLLKGVGKRATESFTKDISRSFGEIRTMSKSTYGTDVDSLGVESSPYTRSGFRKQDGKVSNCILLSSSEREIFLNNLNNAKDPNSYIFEMKKIEEYLKGMKLPQEFIISGSKEDDFVTVKNNIFNGGRLSQKELSIIGKDYLTLRDAEIKERREKERLAAKIRDEVQSYGMEKEKGEYLSIFLGDIVEKERGAYNSMELFEKAKKAGLHYADHSTDYNDGDQYQWSESYNIKGKYYAIKPTKTDRKSYSIYDLKKLGKMIEKDGYEVNISTYGGSYGGREHKIVITKNGKDILQTHKFGVGFLPTHMKGDSFIVEEYSDEKISKAQKSNSSSNKVGKSIKKEKINTVGNGSVKTVLDTTVELKNNKTNSKKSVKSKDSSQSGFKKEPRSIPDNVVIDLIEGDKDYTINRNADKKGIEIFFKKKPTDSVLEKIKEKGFRWSYYGKMWYKKDTGETDAEIGALLKD